MITRLHLIFFLFLGLRSLCAQDLSGVVTIGIESPGGMHIEDNFLYFTEYYDGGRVLKIDLTDSSPEVITMASNLYFPYGVAVWDDFVVVPDLSLGAIWRRRLDPSSEGVWMITSGLEAPIDFALHGDDLYFTHYLWSDSSTQIMKTAVNSFGASEVIMEGFQYANSLTFGPDNELYILDTWAESLYKIDIDASEPNLEIVASGFKEGTALHYWETENKLFISESNSEDGTVSDEGRIICLSLSDENPTPTVLVSNLSSPSGLSVYGSHLYFNEFEKDRILKLSLDFIIDTEEAFIPDLPILYPSLARAYVTLSNIDFRTPIHIVNIRGQRIKSLQVDPGEQINIADLTPGTYYMQVKGRGTLPFIKQ